MRGAGPLTFTVFALAFLTYLAGIAPDVLWGDLAEFQAGAAELDLEFGARSYPLYRLLTHAASAVPVGNLAFRVNLLSALCAAGAVALLFLAASRMGLGTPACLIAAGALAVSHGFWSQAVLAEVYSLHALLLASLALLLLDRNPLTPRRILMAGIVLAAGWFHHRTIVFLYPACLLVLLLRRSEATATRGTKIATVAALLLAAAPLFLLFGAGTDGAEGGLVNALSGGQRTLPARLWYAVRLLVLDFPSPALLTALLGIWVATKRIRSPASAFLLSSAGMLFLFPLLFRWFGDQHVFLLPAFLFLSLLAGVGADRIPWRGLPRAALVASVLLMPPATYFGLAEWFTRPDSPNPFPASRAYARCFFWPPKAGYRHPREFTEGVLRKLAPNATLICTWGEGKTALYLQQVEGLRPDVSIRLIRTGREFRSAVAKSRQPLYVTRYPYFAEHQRPYALPEGHRYDPHEAGETLLRVREE